MKLEYDISIIHNISSNTLSRSEFVSFTKDFAKATSSHVRMNANILWMEISGPKILRMQMF